MAMPKGRKSKLYKTVNVATKSVGTSGAQVHIGTIDKLDAQGVNGYLNNIRFSAMLNDSAGGFSGGFIAYLTTDDTWDDDTIITARAGNFADTVNLVAKRSIQQNNDQVRGNQGLIHLWLEVTDIATVFPTEVRYIAETWGSFIAYTEV